MKENCPKCNSDNTRMKKYWTLTGSAYGIEGQKKRNKLTTYLYECLDCHNSFRVCKNEVLRA